MRDVVHPLRLYSSRMPMAARAARAQQHVGGVAAHHREVAHLAAMAGVVLGIEMQAQAGHGMQHRPVGLAVAAWGRRLQTTARPAD